MALLANTLGYSSYTSESGSDKEKAVILSGWLSNLDQSVITIISTLGIGFNYPHVYWIVHINTPNEISAFSQESGRAGRDGRKVSSIVILSATWKP